MKEKRIRRSISTVRNGFLQPHPTTGDGNDADEKEKHMYHRTEEGWLEALHRYDLIDQVYYEVILYRITELPEKRELENE